MSTDEGEISIMVSWRLDDAAGLGIDLGVGSSSDGLGGSAEGASGLGRERHGRFTEEAGVLS